MSGTDSGKSAAQLRDIAGTFAGIGIGIDGCRGGWAWCARTDGGWRGGVVERLADLSVAIDAAALALVDMPIGLVDAGPAERHCDRAARALLGRPRASSVFRPPSRPALAAADYAEACALNRARTGVALSKQTWNIAPKIRELDTLLARRPAWRERLCESHPEVCLWALAGGRAMRHNKRRPAGREERSVLLGSYDPACVVFVEEMIGRHPRRILAPDDVLDAAVLALSAGLALTGETVKLPEEPPHDARGLPMQMLFAR
ncbi:MAG: DUF429 domain-containing protein [Thiohalocapsa sp.]|nr:DUF429 domain-containing protein [Thiohalocapsa sp.]MCF7992749.1 DUF429 domain-containing protein [Thiohalocapsa sp.]